MDNLIRFPNEKPSIKENLIGALNKENKIELKRLCEDFTEDDIIVELGTYYGMTTKFLAENSKAQIITVDHFKGSEEHQEKPDLAKLIPDMYETFLVNLWEYRDRIQIFKGTTKEFASWSYPFVHKVRLVYIDASHEYDDVFSDIRQSYLMFPNAKICGDDWLWNSVYSAVTHFSSQNDSVILSTNNFWELICEH